MTEGEGESATSRDWLRGAALAGVAGAAAFACVYGAILLLREYGDSLPGLGYTLQLWLYVLLIAVIGTGSGVVAALLGAEWLLGFIGSLGSHLLWLIAVYAGALYVDVPHPNALTLALAGAFGVMLLVSERPAVQTVWLPALGVVALAGAALVWTAPLPAYLVAGGVWTLMPTLGSLVITLSERP